MEPLTTASRGDPDGPLLVVVHGRAEDEQRSLRISQRFDPEGRWFTLAPRAPHRLSDGYYWFTRRRQDTTQATVNQLRQAIVASCEERGRGLEDACLLGFSEGVAALLPVAYGGDASLPAAGVVSIAGFAPRDVRLAGTPPLPPALLIRGVNDTVVSDAHERRLAGTIASLGAEVTRLSFDGGHHVPTEMLILAAVWMDEQRDKRTLE